jgi:hypothetical protein
VTSISKCAQEAQRGSSCPYHFQRPDPPYPDLQLALDASHVLELHAFPPAATGGFPPEEQQLLRHSDSVAVSKVVAFDVSSQASEGDAADDSLVGLAGTVSPSVVVIEAATKRGLVRSTAFGGYAYPAVNISMRCCSVVPGSSLFLRPEKMPSCLSNASPAARLTSIISGCVMSRWGGMV